MAIAFRTQQALRVQEYSMNLDPDLISDMNRWRQSQAAALSPNEAIVALIRNGLGTIQNAPPRSRENSPFDSLAEQFRRALSSDV